MSRRLFALLFLAIASATVIPTKAVEESLSGPTAIWTSPSMSLDFRNPVISTRTWLLVRSRQAPRLPHGHSDILAVDELRWTKPQAAVWNTMTFSAIQYSVTCMQEGQLQRNGSDIPVMIYMYA
jgi:hypothetical protein